MRGLGFERGSFGRRLVGLALVLSLIVGAYVGIATVLLPAVERCIVVHSEPFDAKGWNSRFPCDHRASMAEDLVDDHLTVGMTRDEVVALLGEPDQAYEGVYLGDRTIAYEMGCWMDCNWLVVQFDDAWHLIDAFQYQD